MITKRVGFLGLMAIALAGLFTPAVASAQDRCDYHRYYVPVRVIRHDRYIAREHEIIRRREWRERHGEDRYYR